MAAAGDSWAELPGYKNGKGYADWKAQKNSPGHGWVYAEQTRGGVNIWEYRPGQGAAPPGTAPPGGGGYGGGYGGGGGGNAGMSQAEADAKALASRIASWTNAYWGLIEKSGGKLSKEAKALIAWAAKNKEMPSLAAFVDKMREDDQESFLLTGEAETRRTQIKLELTNIFGVDWDPKDKAMRALILKYQLGDKHKLTKEVFFDKYVTKSAAFIARYAGFAAWQKARGGDKYLGFTNYLNLRTSFTDAYAALFGRATPIPPDLLAKALAGNWALDGKDWQDAIAGDSNWGSLTGYTDRVHFFEDQWKAIFGASQFKDLAVPADLAKRFGQTTGEPNAEFDRFFQTSIRDSLAFKTAFPDFEPYAQATFERTGTQPSGVGDFLARRADYIERYKGILEDPDAMPDPALLAKALAGNWSNTQWDLTIEKNDPKYKNTEAYKAKEGAKIAKGDSFDLYWKRMFGENSTPDGTLKGEFVASASTDVESLWEQIKNTGEFRSQYAQWDAFATAQNAQGQNVMEDPGLYKQYQKAFYDAFSNQGMQAPGGLDRMFFASGIDPNAFASNLAQYGQNQAAYQWQSGETADVATAAGIGDKAAGGDLRKRLDEALKQHQAYAASKFQSFRPEEIAGTIAQRI